MVAIYLHSYEVERARQIGIVILAIRNYPIAARVMAAHRIVAALDGGRPFVSHGTTY